MDSPVASLPLIAPQPGFFCGTVPVPTATEGQSKELVIVPASSMEVVSDSSVSLRYSFLPAEMDLNDLPANWLKREELVLLDPQLLTDKEAPDRDSDDLCRSCSNRSLAQPLPKKCEDLVVNGLAAYGDEIDFIAPASVMKQIFKTPYSKAPISVAVHRIGKTLILNDGPDAVESKTKQSSQTMTLNKDLFYKFVHHSVASAAPSFSSNSEPGSSQSPQENPCRAWQFYSGGRAQSEPYVETVDSPVCPSSPHSTGFQTEDGEDDATWQHNDKPRPAKRRGFGSRKRGKPGCALGKRGVTSQSVGVTSTAASGLKISPEAQAASEEELTSSEAEDAAGIRGPKASERERFLRVLFWKFRELQMLLGSDLLLFGNDQHKAVSLHLMEVERQMSPLTWLDAWLDNMMANVPELAVCYHKQGVVQGYELLKTDDLFLLKGVGADGTIPFHPQVVHANAAAVLQFLRKNCTSEPGAYWLVKNAGEDLMQLFDLSTISDDADVSDASDDEASPLPDTVRNPRGPESYKQALALLIYRLALQLARSKASSDQRRSGSLLMQCLELMEEKHVPDLVAAAHERMARLCLEQAIPPPPTGPQLLLEAAPSKQLLLPTESGVGNEFLPALGDGSSPGIESDEQPAKVSSPSDVKSSMGDERKDERRESAGLSEESARTTERETTEVEAEAKDERVATSASQEAGVTGSQPEPDESGGVSVQDSGSDPATVSGVENPPDKAGSLGASHDLGREGEERVSADVNSTEGSTSGPSEAEREEDINRHVSAVHHFSQAIRALREELTMLNSRKSGRRRPRRHVSGDGLESVTDGLGRQEISGTQEERGCNCKGSRHEARVVRTEAKMQKLMGCLAESYLELGRAYEGDAQLARALKAAEIASVVGRFVDRNEGRRQIAGKEVPRRLESYVRESEGNTDAKVDNSREGSGATQKDERSRGMMQLRKDGGDLLERNTEPGRRSRRKASGEGTTASADRRSLSRGFKGTKVEFWGALWAFVGDLYAKLQRSGGEEALLTQQAALLSGAPRLEEAVTYEVERLRQGLRVSEAGTPDGSSGGTAGTSGSKSERKTVRGGRAAASDADLLCFGRPLTLDYDVNLTAALESYSKAIAAMESEDGATGGAKWELAHRRMGWTCNELGRRRLEEGDISTAEGLFTQALGSFGAVKDTANAVLVHCNMGHARRGQAEAMVAEGAALEQTLAGERLKQVRTAHTVRCYRQALSHYIAARAELLSLGDTEAQRSLRGLWTEAHTQLGHTYLRFGMFLASLPADVSKADDVSKEAPSELLTKALHLYESLGPGRGQEAAYSHCQLAAHFRDRCVGEFPADTGSGSRKRNEDARGKRFAALAERHWQKALEYYRAESHPDMYIQICIQRSRLALKCAGKARPSNAMEAGLSHLARVPQVFEPRASAPGSNDKSVNQAHPNPSPQILADLKGHLEWVARELLQAYVSFLKHKSCPDADADVANEKLTKLKRVYRDLLNADSSQAVVEVLTSMLNG
ncbi:hypothetical protein KFL_000750050 [Klebsormidium nitens]|uniref:EDRF1 N-terminal domain-containing protein n=1 Tax=Klebsormidium nitens TaxID=105231 RepID=A0A0U9HJ68_KLENI|nr:hypothetical protein KFL_000750050 [Klebsormidium nitens]|eukprot:GAQ81236.1 hypothetical protein KFL_000750050 [Klebsormidium nitens]